MEVQEMKLLKVGILSNFPARVWMLGMENGLVALETSMVLLHTDLVSNEELGLVEDPNVVESICFTQGMDEYWAQKRKEGQSFWNSLGVSYPQTFFGSVTGAFRWYPGRPIDICGTYDPRIRPW